MKQQNQKLRPPTKSLNCSKCGMKRENVGGDTVSIICWKCVNEGLRSSSGKREKGEDE
jgi:hypothetical protein